MPLGRYRLVELVAGTAMVAATLAGCSNEKSSTSTIPPFTPDSLASSTTTTQSAADVGAQATRLCTQAFAVPAGTSQGQARATVTSYSMADKSQLPPAAPTGYLHVWQMDFSINGRSAGRSKPGRQEV